MEHNSYLSVDILESYDLFLRRKRLALLILLSVLAALMLFAAASGSSGITVSQVLETVLGRGTTQTEAIVFRVRLPRVMTAVAVGAALALSGCIMQNVLHNPLASASTLGVSQGAAFGAALAIIALDAGVQNAANAGTAITIRSPGTVTVCRAWPSAPCSPAPPRCCNTSQTTYSWLRWSIGPSVIWVAPAGKKLP